METDTAVPTTGRTDSLSIKQLKAFQKGEPKTLGAIQIIIAMLTLCLSVILIKQNILVRKAEAVLLAAALLTAMSGTTLVHAGRKPSYYWVKLNVSMHFASAGIAIAGFGLLSKHVSHGTFQWDKVYVNGIMGTLIVFLVLELLICITAMLYALNTMITEGPEDVPSSSPIPEATDTSAVPTESQEGLTGVEAQKDPSLQSSSALPVV